MSNGSSQCVRILVADDHELLRAGICAIISHNPRWGVCGQAENGEVAIQKALELKSDVVVLDISMPYLNGIEATRTIREALRSTKIIILTMHESPQVELAARQAGADAVVTKRMAADSLTRAIESVFQEGASIGSQQLDAAAH